ncbi:BolA family protein [Zavarzinia sp. CC-PAN008]|uniref:BolA family protein n=1 Tax=Zavarzinia sp. CC-PAN008 TaxID=3243332 RepID=UPI003F743677
MSRSERIRAALAQRFSPTLLDVVDESHQHAGHAGARPGGETHFRVRIVAPAFAGLSRVARHRQVNQALAAELEAGLHALAIEAAAPGEAGA